MCGLNFNIWWQNTVLYRFRKFWRKMHVLFFACVGNGQNHAATVVGNGPKSDITGKANLTEWVFRLKFFQKKFCGFCPVNIQPFTKNAA